MLGDSSLERQKILSWSMVSLKKVNGFLVTWIWMYNCFILDLDIYLNETRIRQRYRMHNAYVMATVPKGNDINWNSIVLKRMTSNDLLFHGIHKIVYLFIISKMAGTRCVSFLGRKFHQFQFLMIIDSMTKEAIRRRVEPSWIHNSLKIGTPLSRKVLIMIALKVNDLK